MLIAFFVFKCIEISSLKESDADLYGLQIISKITRTLTIRYLLFGSTLMISIGI